MLCSSYEKMKGCQSFIFTFTASILLATLPVFASIQDVEQEVNRELIEGYTYTSIFQKTCCRSESLKNEINKEVPTMLVTLSAMTATTNKQQYIKSIIEKIDKKCNKIVLTITVDQLVLEVFEFFTKEPLLEGFLEAISYENGIRQVENVDPLQIYLQIPVDSVHDFKNLHKLMLGGSDLGPFIFKEGVISGLIFESSLIQEQVGFNANELLEFYTTTDLWTSVFVVKEFIKAVELSYGYDLKMGLLMNNYGECGSVFLNVPKEITSLFDFILYDGFSGQNFYRERSWFSEKANADLYSYKCRQHFIGQDYYRVKQKL